jgi:hypothetical protein
VSAEGFRLLLLAPFPFFASLRSDQLEALLGEVQFMEVPQGSAVFNADQPCPCGLDVGSAVHLLRRR